MRSTPIRGAILVALAALLGFIVLRGIPDRDQLPITATTTTVIPTALAQVTPTPDAGSIALPTATAIVDTSNARPNSQVSVLVANGTAISGQAGRLTDALRNQGFNTREPKNADDRTASVIYYRPGFEVEAQVVHDILNTDTPIAQMPVPDPIAGDGIDLGPVDVFIWVGADPLSTS